MNTAIEPLDLDALPALLKPEEAASVLRRSTRTLRRLISIGVLTPVRIGGGRPLFRRADIERLLGGKP